MKRKRSGLQTTLRFRKRVRVWRFVAVNFSRRGLSVSVGQRGVTLNVGRQGLFITLSAYGTGISYRIGAPWLRVWHWTRTWIAARERKQKPTQEMDQGDEPWTGMT